MGIDVIPGGQSRFGRQSVDGFPPISRVGWPILDDDVDGLPRLDQRAAGEQESR